MWLFRNRSWLPVPGVLLLLLFRAGESRTAALLPAGIGLVLAGAAIRIWSVRHIGTISRTRAGRLGPLVTTGPYGLTRNPLYIANGLLWTGAVVLSGLLWMLPVAWLLFAAQYAAIVRWEEAALLGAHGAAYATYRTTVRRWRPRWDTPIAAPALLPWRGVLFSERGTLLAISAITTLLLVKTLLG